MTTTTTASQIVPGRTLSTADFYWITNAQPGTPLSQIESTADRDADTAAFLGAITVARSAGRTLAVCTDLHRIHAVTIGSRTPEGVYTASSGYRRHARLSHTPAVGQLRRLLLEAQRVNDDGAVLAPHPLTIRASAHRAVRTNLLEALDRHPISTVVFRSRSITVHDPDSLERLAVIDRAAGLRDRMRQHRLVAFDSRVIREPIEKHITTYTSAGPMRPFTGQHRNRLAVLMPTWPAPALVMWNTDGTPHVS